MNLTPPELGLPKKFKFWRDGQLEAIEAISQSQKPTFLLDAPTGAGKSLIGIGAYSKIAFIQATMDRMKGEEHQRYRCVYITRTLQLQEQILSEFPMARKVMGRSNYPCLLRLKDFPDFTADDCVNTKEQPCPSFSLCLYRVAKKEALMAPLAVLNDAYFLGETSGPGLFSGCNLLVVDEIDSIESALMNFIQFTVSEPQLKRLQLKPPPNLEGIQNWLMWAGITGSEIERARQGLDRQLELQLPSEWSDVEIDMHRQSRKLENFGIKLAQFIELVNNNWIFTYDEGGKGDWKVTFKPILVAPYADRYLWRHSKRALGMSGTIFDDEILANDIGIEDWDYLRMDSLFPVENRPIYYQPVVNLTRDRMDTELPKLAEAISKILDSYSEHRVLIHTISYKVRDFLMGTLSQQSRLMTHTTANREEMLETFKHSLAPVVMISPSFDRGIDLKDEACRCVIIAKMPYMDLSDKQIKARMSLPRGQRWYNLKAAQTLVQMSGRAVRSKDDWAHTFILDRQFESLLARTRHFLPKWWLEAIRMR